MQTEYEIRQDEVKLDSVLSLVFFAQDNGMNLLGSFHDRYGILFFGELERLETILFEDGLIQYAVRPEGLEIVMTREGLAFINHGGYGSEMVSTISRRPGKIHHSGHFRNYMILAGFFFLMLTCFIIFNKKG